jgi:hypothetical protein
MIVCFQPCLMYVDKATSLPSSEAPEKFFTRVSFSHTRKHKTGVKRLARDKHSSLLRTLINYGNKKFVILGPAGFNVFIVEGTTGKALEIVMPPKSNYNKTVISINQESIFEHCGKVK